MKSVTVSIFIALVLIGAAFVFSREGGEDFNLKNQNKEESAPYKDNVTIENGVQIVDIRAKAGYEPRRSIAKAGIPTIIRFDSKGTFDCSASVRIPSMKINESLNFSGSTDINIGVQQVGILKGSCSMGMYPFEIEFKI